MKKGVKKRIIAMSLGVILLLLSACAQTVPDEGAEEEKDAAIVYREISYTLPFLEEGITSEDFCELSDGKWAVWTSDNRLYTVAAGEKQWTEVSYEDGNGWYESRKEGIMRTRLAENGARFSYAIFTEQTEGAEGKSGEMKIDYLYVGADGKTAEGSYLLGEEEYIADFYLSEEGRLFCSGGGKLYEVEPESGEREFLIETQNMTVPFFDGNIMMVPDTGGLYLYDINAGEQLPQNPVMDAFLKEKQGYSENTYLKADEEGNIYILLQDGFYRYLKNGNSVEQIFDAQITQKGTMEAEKCIGLYSGNLKEFQMFYSDGSRRVYGEHIVREPDVILKVYRLQKEGTTDDDMREAIRIYQELHPEVRIEYTIGMMGGTSGLTKEDVIKKLNLELTAGNGPDLLILDGLPVDSYIEQGILADISSIVNRVDEKDGLLPQITKHYYEADGSVYRIPLGFTINIACGPESILGEGETVTLRELADNLSAYYEKEENWPEPSGQADGWWVVDIGRFDWQILRMAPACMGAWVTEDGSLNEEAVTEYLLCMKKLQEVDNLRYLKNSKYLEYEAQNPGATVTDWWVSMSDSKEEKINGIITQYDSLPNPIVFPQQYVDNMIPCWFLGPGEVGNLEDHALGGAASMMKIIEEEPDRVWKVFDGQTEHTFNPRKTMGITENSGNREEAEAFLEFLLSAENAPDQYTLTFSVNQTVLEKNFADKEVIEYVTCSVDCGEYVKKMREIIAQLKQPSPDYSTLLDVVAQEGSYYLFGDCTVEEAVEKIKQRMELYMAE